MDVTKLSGLQYKILEMAGRIRDLREISRFTPEEMAQKTGTTTEEYLLCEEGKSDLNFAFLYRCASAFGVDVTDIIEGESPKLSTYTLTRFGEGQKIEQAHEMIYYNMAAGFKNRIADPLYVINKYSDEAFNSPIELTTHVGQEFDLVIRGSLKVQVGDHTEILYEGDSIYYDSGIPHGMVAAGGEDCIFYAVVLHDQLQENAVAQKAILPETRERKPDTVSRIYENFISTREDENGKLEDIKFRNQEKFNFAFDVVDELGRNKPDKLALLYVSEAGEEKEFTFKDIKDGSSQAANYFTSLGIKRGDKVLLVLKRHYQFWFSVLALHKIGAVAIPASNQLLSHDFSYRIKAAGVKAIVCTANGDVAHQFEIGEKEA